MIGFRRSGFRASTPQPHDRAWPITKRYGAGFMFLVLVSVYEVLHNIGERILYIGCPFGDARNVDPTSYVWGLGFRL